MCPDGKIAVCWSGGKDSAFLLHRLKAVEGREIACLVTIAEEKNPLIWIHGYSHSLLEHQCRCLEIPLVTIWFGKGKTYRSVFAEIVDVLRESGVENIAYGDISCDTIRDERLRLHSEFGMTPCFPLWNMGTTTVARRFLESNHKAIVTCVSLDHLDPCFCGRDYDEQFVADLPDGVDPCGENGEFHTFVYDGPLFSQPVPFVRSDVETAECFAGRKKVRFAFCRGR